MRPNTETGAKLLSFIPILIIFKLLILPVALVCIGISGIIEDGLFPTWKNLKQDQAYCRRRLEEIRKIKQKHKNNK